MSTPHRSVLSLKRTTADQAPALEERLHKVLANAGHGSRRMLEQRIGNGEIAVNGETASIGRSVHAGDRVEVDHHLFVVASDTREHAEVLLYNKPEGIVVTREDTEGRPTVFEQLPEVRGGRWVAVGRLDINTTGLLLLTTDGDLANALMHPSSEVEREYLCRIRGDVSSDMIARLREGVDLDDGPANFREIIPVSESAGHGWFRVTLAEGRNREVRRLWESQDVTLSRLKRIRYGGIDLPRQLRRGACEALAAEGVRDLRRKAGLAEPRPALTLAPVSRQRRAHRNVTEFKPDRSNQAEAWTGGYRNEARELRAFDRIRDDSPRHANKRKRGPSGDVNGNVAPPEKSRPRKHKNKRGAAPGQELPSVRTWFAGDSRGKGGRKPANGRNGHRGQGSGRGGGRNHGNS